MPKPTYKFVQFCLFIWQVREAPPRAAPCPSSSTLESVWKESPAQVKRKYYLKKCQVPFFQGHLLHHARKLGLPHRPLPHPGARNLRQDETGQAGKVSDAKLYA